MSEVMVIVQLPVPEQLPPLQPPNVYPELPVGVKITVWLLVNWAEQFDPQSIPVGELIMTPPPPGDVIVRVCWTLANVAVTD
jgi:hypothetical protein